MPENKITAPKFDAETDYPGFNDDSKARAINQAHFQLKEIAASKSWRLVAFYSTSRIIFRNKKLGFFKKLSQSIETFKDSFNGTEPVLAARHDSRSERERQLALFGKEVRQNGRIASPAAWASAITPASKGWGKSLTAQILRAGSTNPVPDTVQPEHGLR